MAKDLYWRDVLLWSEQQAELLRRVARGERVNGLDWDHVIEEIEDVGASELHSVQSLLRQAMVHLLKSAAWPAAEPRFAPSMRQEIDLEREYRTALKQVQGVTVGGRPPASVPEHCPFTLDALLAADREMLEQQLAASVATQLHENQQPG